MFRKEGLEENSSSREIVDSHTLEIHTIPNVVNLDRAKAFGGKKDVYWNLLRSLCKCSPRGPTLRQMATQVAQSSFWSSWSFCIFLWLPATVGQRPPDASVALILQCHRFGFEVFIQGFLSWGKRRAGSRTHTRMGKDLWPRPVLLRFTRDVREL